MDRIYLPSNKKDLKLVPWKNWKQWELIFRDLYNNNTSAQIEAIKIVSNVLYFELTVEGEQLDCKRKGTSCYRSHSDVDGITFKI